ncbi:MAG: Gfo/Idh/MocA family oxidoreductase [Planctomycetota bacterium]
MVNNHLTTAGDCGADSPKRIGLMGLGHVARYAHVPSITQTPALHLAAIYEPFGQVDKAELNLSDTTAVCTKEDDFFAQDLDAVVVTSPAPFHGANIAAAGRHGLPVLCEKPLTDDPTEAEQIVQACRTLQQPLYLAYCYRFSSVAQRIRELLQRGAVGEVKVMRLVYNWDVHGMYDGRDADAAVHNARWHGRMVEGGPMVDCGVHQIDLAQWWTQSPVVSVDGRGVWAVDYDAPSHVWGHMDHADGTHTCVEMSCTFGHTCKKPQRDFCYQVMGTEGVIVFDPIAGRFDWEHQHGTESFPLANEKDFSGMYRAFAHALRTGQTGDLCTPEQAVENTKLAWQMLDAAHDKRTTLHAAALSTSPNGPSVPVIAD